MNIQTLATTCGIIALGDVAYVPIREGRAPTPYPANTYAGTASAKSILSHQILKSDPSSNAVEYTLHNPFLKS